MSDNSVIEFGKVVSLVMPVAAASEGYSFTAEVDKDIKNLCKAINVSPEDAVQIAKDFYKKYPMLMEWVRSPEILLDKSENSIMKLTITKSRKNTSKEGVCMVLNNDNWLMEELDLESQTPVLDTYLKVGVCKKCKATRNINDNHLCAVCNNDCTVLGEGEI
jgi:hypothetical protein